MKFYRVAEHVPSLGTRQQDLRAVKTGEKRPPKAGEWFISGAIPEAHRATNDLRDPYLIAKLVVVEEVVSTRVVRDV